MKECLHRRKEEMKSVRKGFKKNDEKQTVIQICKYYATLSFEWLYIYFGKLSNDISSSTSWRAASTDLATRFYRPSLSAGTIYQPLRSGRIWHKVNF